MNRKPEALLQTLSPAEITRLIDERLARVVAGTATHDLEPFFQPAPIAKAMLRQQSVMDQEKWSTYFAHFGCLICNRIAAKHEALGMCGTCLSRTRGRLNRIKRRLARSESKASAVPFKNVARAAREAVRAGTEPPQKLPRRRKTDPGADITEPVTDAGGFLDTEQLAREALAPSVKKLAEKRQR